MTMLVIQSYNASAKFDCSSNYDARGTNIFILTNLSYSSNILQHNKPTRLKRINMFVTSTKYLLSALLLASVAENAYGQVSRKS